jgi:biopolymer transport protein ExbD
MLHFDDRPVRKARIEIIPMIDVMMFLLVFFVLISVNVIPAFGLHTTLPDSKSAQRALVENKPAVVTVLSDGSVALDGQTLGTHELAARVAELHVRDVHARVVVNADQSVRWQAVVDVMDLLRGAGINAVTFSTHKVGA